MLRTLILALVAVPALVPVQALSGEILTECEDYFTFEDLGESLIRVVTCHYASGDKAVAGFDVLDEWIELEVWFPEDGEYDVSLRCAGLKDLKSTVGLTLYTDQGPAKNQTSDVQVLGTGIG
jgi:hypothetical protein